MTTRTRIIIGAVIGCALAVFALGVTAYGLSSWANAPLVAAGTKAAADAAHTNRTNAILFALVLGPAPIIGIATAAAGVLDRVGR